MKNNSFEKMVLNCLSIYIMFSIAKIIRKSEYIHVLFNTQEPWNLFVFI